MTHIHPAITTAAAEQQQAHDAEKTRKWAVEQAIALSPTLTTGTGIIATAKLLVDYVYDV